MDVERWKDYGFRKNGLDGRMDRRGSFGGTERKVEWRETEREGPAALAPRAARLRNPKP